MRYNRHHSLIEFVLFISSLSFLVFLFGIVLGVLKADDFREFYDEAKNAVRDSIQHPLTSANRFDTKPGLVYYTNFTDEGYLLMSGYLVEEERVGIKLIDLSGNTVVKSWYPDPSVIRQASDYPNFRKVNRFEPQSPYLMADGGLVFIDNQGPLVRIDACSNIEWIVDGHFHHSLERDLDGNFIVPGQ